MAKKGNRVQVILECTEHKESGRPGTSRYITTKNKKNTPERLEIKNKHIGWLASTSFNSAHIRLYRLHYRHT
jgi:large subunit ribosomal protein L33